MKILLKPVKIMLLEDKMRILLLQKLMELESSKKIIRTRITNQKVVTLFLQKTLKVKFMVKAQLNQNHQFLQEKVKLIILLMRMILLQ